ncbi:restriction endonuclease subunit S [Methylibium sp.]|uniref:restriction endonuclease subunit S n=1 Tax=Methylibium sp. TaxID=2067992 RepID=UPI003D0D1E18
MTNDSAAWTTLRLGEVCQKIGSGATPRGGGSVYAASGVAFIRSQNVLNSGFSREGLTYLSEELAFELRNVAVAEGDVLVNITGDSVARVCQAPAGVLPARVNQHVAIVRPDPERLDPSFLRYYLIQPAVQEELLSLASAGATRNALTKAMLERLDVVAPRGVRQQRAVSRPLILFDDRIELNRRISQTLETIAQAIFKSWFVDFEHEWPTTEWDTRPLDSVADYLNGLALQKYPPIDGEASLPVIKITQLRAGHIKSADRANQNVPAPYVINDGDLLFSWSGSLEVAFWCGGKGALNQHLFKVTSSMVPSWYAYLWTKHHLPEFRAIAANKATTMGHIQRKHLTAAQVLLPPPPILEAMDAVMKPIVAELIQRRLEAKTLAELRDELLPKLMSGQLVPKLEAATP